MAPAVIPGTQYLIVRMSEKLHPPRSGRHPNAARIFFAFLHAAVSHILFVSFARSAEDAHVRRSHPRSDQDSRHVRASPPFPPGAMASANIGNIRRPPSASRGPSRGRGHPDRVARLGIAAIADSFLSTLQPVAERPAPTAVQALVNDGRKSVRIGISVGGLIILLIILWLLFGR